jgi:hypothetical protein
VSCALSNNFVAAVAIRTTVVDGKKQFLVAITISPAEDKVTSAPSRAASGNEAKQTSSQKLSPAIA